MQLSAMMIQSYHNDNTISWLFNEFLMSSEFDKIL